MTDYRGPAVSSIAPSSIYASETDSISPLLNNNVGALQDGAATAPILYKYDSSGLKDPNEIVVISVPVVISESAGGGAVQRRKSLFSKFKGDSTPKTKFKIVLMPRSECDLYFAKDQNGAYVGTQDQRQWTEEELDARYGKYKIALPMAPIRYQTQDQIIGSTGFN